MVNIQTIIKQPLNLLFVAYGMVVLALIFMIKSSYDMKGAYDYGAGLQAECGPVFMERERPDFQAYTTYTNTVYRQFKTAYSILAAGILMVILGYSLWLIVCFLRAAVIKGLPSSTNLYFYAFEKKFETPPSNLGFKMQKYGLPLLLVAGMITLMTVWGVGSFSQKGVQLSPFLMSSENGVLYTDNKKIVTNNSIYLSAVFGTILVGTMLYNPIFQNSTTTPIPAKYIGHIVFIYVVMMVIIPVFVDVIADFQNKIKLQYESDKTKLNDQITNILEEGTTQATNLRVELEKNIMKAESKRLVSGGEGAPDLSNLQNTDYKDTVYQYVMHVTNDTDIVGIPIPQELKNIIRPTYLTGEQTILLKRKFIEVYNRHRDGTAITKATLHNGDDKDLLPFLIPDVALKMATSDAADDAVRNKYIALLTAYVVNNRTLQNGNPLPSSIINIMTKMRQDSSMKEVIGNYFTKVNSLIVFILIAYTYYIYHSLYRNYPEHTVQKVSLFAFLLLVILGFAGWFTKELWI